MGWGGERRAGLSHPSPHSLVCRSKLMDIWEELKRERERRRLLEVGAVRIPESRQEGGWWRTLP